MPQRAPFVGNKLANESTKVFKNNRVIVRHMQDEVCRAILINALQGKFNVIRLFEGSGKELQLESAKP
jgi:hypothetical protein